MAGQLSQYPRMVQMSSHVIFDETAVISKLKSPLYAATSLAVRLTMDVVSADVVAARITHFGGTGGESRLVLVDSRVPALSRMAIETWMEEPQSAFGRMTRDLQPPGVFRISDGPNDASGARGREYHPIGLYTTVADALALTCDLTNSARATLAYLRCGTHDPFTDEDVDALRRLRPVIADAIRGSQMHERAGNSPAGEATASAGSMFGSPMSLEQMLNRLTPTEQHVLRQLRTNASEKAIAEGMHRSPHTIHVHVKNIYRKLNIGSRRQIADMFGPFGGDS